MAYKAKYVDRLNVPVTPDLRKYVEDKSLESGMNMAQYARKMLELARSVEQQRAEDVLTAKSVSLDNMDVPDNGDWDMPEDM